MKSIKSTTAAFAVLIGLTGCGLFGDQPCDSEPSELLIRTDQSSYSFGETATLKIENCTSEDVFVDHVGHGEYFLQKKTTQGWKTAVYGVSLGTHVFEQLEPGDERQERIPAEPSNEFVDSIPGDYRFQLFIYDDRLSNDGQLLPLGKRVSNTFEVTE